MERISGLEVMAILLTGCASIWTPGTQGAQADLPGVEIKTVEFASPFRSEDGSIIRSLPAIANVQSVHCTLPRGDVIRACRHKTVSQIWYVLEGRGEIWLKDLTGHEMTTELLPGVALSVPVGYSFQFRNTGPSDLKVFIVNTSPWSGDGELIPVEDHWPSRISGI